MERYPKILVPNRPERALTAPYQYYTPVNPALLFALRQPEIASSNERPATYWLALQL
jgi:hypothetical protein